MDELKPIYITTTLPYVNSAPHIGFAMEIVRADAIARYYAHQGHPVFFNTGTDEHGQKIYEKAQSAQKDVQEYVDEWAESFRGLKEVLGLFSELRFIRTTDDHHIQAAQEMWRRCDTNGSIYKKNYQAKYCVGCELEKTDSELVDGRCPIHPDRELSLVDEENYFFKFSAFSEQLLGYYSANPTFVRPDFRFNEIKSFIQQGLQDFSISRLKTKMPWGVPVPGDDDHVMYVWFDALTNYISTLGWPDDTDGLYSTFWEHGMTIQYAGKDNLRQQSAMWQSMLFAAGLPSTDTIVINGFINSGGQKMSKSLGNVINPYDIVSHYGTDCLRYYVLRHVSSFEDSDVTLPKIHEAYTAHLVNGVGNLVSRILKMSETHLSGEDLSLIPMSTRDVSDYHAAFASFDLQKASDFVWSLVNDLDATIAKEAPFRVVKEDVEKGKELIRNLLPELRLIGELLIPLLPATSSRIFEALEANTKPEEPLFSRKDELVM